jgi:poly(hydroxyalkanoate) depolymerase family esterase
MAGFMEEMIKARDLTRQGDLAQATQLIQQALRMQAPVPAGQAARAPGGDIIDVEARVVEGRPQRGIEMPAPAHAPGPAFTEHAFESEAGKCSYRLFVPGRTGGKAPRPVLVLLHGCKQDALDFAKGTHMNDVAQREQCIVIYPEQSHRANAMGCWNWFEPAHQARGRGEPAVIAALTQQVIREHGGDPSRVYICGLSAGGAMAAVVAGQYPDVFAAAGVHSGLPAGIATDMTSALGAMRRAPRGTAGEPGAAPVIVFHGTSDRTVHPGNGKEIVQAAAAAYEAAGVALHRTQAGPVTRFSAPDGTPLVEHWEIRGGSHAWSGGSPEGSFTAPAGPDASAAMMAFFLQHRLPKG